ncbi:S phase cyclin A-associated protein in the endoplasmic reticulum-like [Ctenocephalides felis]|uniref:S phase cyclin A-associated protein in the endoplasmic reticulum-like n=1 Tax=Ctenocephalides felis TaxID=7515 RepID=UPI000E6E2750|nr:S phase cyclin A-associated protein in the endoplasmic reticulum-like [Ctenocephalides felis]
MALLLASARGSLESNPSLMSFAEESLVLLNCFIRATPFDKNDPSQDVTKMMETIRSTELLGCVSMLYCVATPIGQAENQPMSTLKLASKTFSLLKTIADKDLTTFQCASSADGVSLQFRHVCNTLLAYCSSASNEHLDGLLNDVLQTLGLFSIGNRDNQMVLVSGPPPCVLVRLAALPFRYFSRPALVRILFPTLIAATAGNTVSYNLLHQDMDVEVLEDFRKSPEGQECQLLKLFKERDQFVQESRQDSTDPIK